MQEIDDFLENPDGQIFIGIVLVLIVFLFWRDSKRRNRVKAEKKAILKAVSSGSGANGADVHSALEDVVPDANFDGARFATQIYDSIYFIIGTNISFWTDEPKIYSALSNKTKAQIRSIELSFQQLYDRTLDEFLKSGLDESEYKKCISIIQQAK